MFVLLYRKRTLGAGSSRLGLRRSVRGAGNRGKVSAGGELRRLLWRTLTGGVTGLLFY